jgi:hypothetical protein
MQAERESRGISLLILNFNATWGWVVKTTHRRLTPRKESQYLLCMRFCGSQGRYGKEWKREDLIPPLEFEPRAVEPVTSRYTDDAIPASRLNV